MKKKKLKIAIIGGGPAGCFCAYWLQKYFSVTIYEYKSPLQTLIPTGGGRCNLAHYEFDNKELARCYPRGEKFLYSVFSRFSTADTLDFFDKIGVPTYVQEDMRVFPKSNSSIDVREKLLNNLKNVLFKKEKVIKVLTNPLRIVTEKKEDYFDKIVIAIGGHNSYAFIKSLGHKIIEPKPALTSLKTKERFTSLSGVSIKNVEANGLIDDLLFTHNGLSGPLIYKISSLKARDKTPYTLLFDLLSNIDLQKELNENPHKSIKNILSDHLPKSLVEYLLKKINVDAERKAHLIDGKQRDAILFELHNFEVEVVSPTYGGEVVTSGGVDLKEINPKNLESKIVEGVYFCGEVMDIDGFCGGYNLQNCWSSAFCVAEGLKSILNN